MQRLRRVLMVALRYPPASGTGIIRTLKYQKYLPLHGWVGDTLTGPLEAETDAFSEEPAREGPGRTFRVRFPDPIREADRMGDTPVANALRRVARYALAPDGQALFVPAAFSRAAGILDRYDAVYASGMPWSGLLAAAALKTRRPRSTVLGLRDPWIEPDGVRFGRLRNRVESALERLALRAADAVVVTAEGLRQDLVRRRPWLAGKIHVIPNGYDEEDFDGPPANPLSPFDIVHTGNFYGTKGPDDLFAGVRRWFDAHPRRRPKVRVRLVGPIRGADRDAAARAGIEDVVVFDGSVTHAEAVARLRAGRVAVAVDFGPDQARTRVLSKIFEYMRSGRPILFLSSDGGTAEMLRPCPRATIVPKQDPEAVAAALESIASRAPAPDVSRREPYTERFERRVLAGMFAEVLTVISDGRSAEGR